MSNYLDYETYRHAIVGCFCVTGTNKQWAIDVISKHHNEINQAYIDGIYHGDWCRKLIDQNKAGRG